MRAQKSAIIPTANGDNLPAKTKIIPPLALQHGTNPRTISRQMDMTRPPNCSREPARGKSEFTTTWKNHEQARGYNQSIDFSVDGAQGHP
jgi:hypothetical protein